MARLVPYCPRCEPPPAGDALPILCERHMREAWVMLAHGGERRKAGGDRRKVDELGPWKVRGERRRRDRRRAP